MELHIKLNNFKRGKETWKFNTSLLKNVEYTEMINKTIEEEKLKYIVPIYNPLNVNIISNKEIQFTISVSLFLDTLLMTIRGKTMRFSSKLKKTAKYKRNRINICNICIGKDYQSHNTRKQCYLT